MKESSWERFQDRSEKRRHRKSFLLACGKGGTHHTKRNIAFDGNVTRMSSDRLTNRIFVYFINKKTKGILLTEVKKCLQEVGTTPRTSRNLVISRGCLEHTIDSRKTKTENRHAVSWWKNVGSQRTNEGILGKNQSRRKETFELTWSTSGRIKAKTNRKVMIFRINENGKPNFKLWGEVFQDVYEISCRNRNISKD